MSQPRAGGLFGGASITPLDGQPYAFPGAGAGPAGPAPAPAAAAGLLSPEAVQTAKAYLRAQAVRVAKLAPMTTLQILVGLGLHAATATGAAPAGALLFHPRLVLPPHAQWYRIPLAFMTLGLSTPDVLQRVVGLFYWQAPFEQDMARAPPAAAGQSVPGSFPQAGGSGGGGAGGASPAARGGFVQGVVEYVRAINPRFLKTQLVAAAVIVAMELALSQNAHARQQGGMLHLFPYTLYPVLEHAMRWLWAMTAHEREAIPVMGIVRIEPVMIPLAMMVMGGFGSVASTAKGLAAAFVAARVLDLRRWNGEPAADWFRGVALAWYRWIAAQAAALSADARK
ncbi:hypothetical protein HK105_206332 [Polyrhizophydium stewartii]|uniref:Uncharacterized protein n=1 Tax=Polyrhizophydium stewartii TaxID=2732419 RepID=A0ABR4N3J7_9FUNG|nr:hypothetical protein HK105_005018 [Polyrhizophydium stewartii]